MGSINSQNEFVTERSIETGFMRKHQGFGISRETLGILRRNHVEEIVFKFKESTTTSLYRSCVRDFYDFGIEHRKPDGDVQLIVPLEKMRGGN